MLCNECGGKYMAKKGSIEIADPFAGSLKVNNVEYSQCEGCGNQLLPLETARKIGKVREAALQSLIQAQPISAFVSATEAADYLEITRQALHKHQRIRRGFVFQTRIDDKVLLFAGISRAFQENR